MEQAFRTSPIHSALGLTLEVRGEGDVLVHLAAPRGVGNRSGMVSGGALAAMIDSVVIQSWQTLIKEPCRIVTIEMKINFLESPPADEPLIGIASLERVGRSISVGIGRIVDESKNCYAFGVVTAKRLRPKLDP
jgi:uncharacterized protein (TIGR00369 family)